MEELVDGVDVVLVSGGMCRITYVRQRLEWLFGAGIRVEPAMNAPENTVVVGLANLRYCRNGRDLSLPPTGKADCGSCPTRANGCEPPWPAAWTGSRSR